MSWPEVMITGSKYYLLQAKGRPAGRWGTADTRTSVARVKHCIGVHVYMGITYWGSTQLIFVRLAHTSSAASPSAPRPHVFSLEYAANSTATITDAIRCAEWHADMDIGATPERAAAIAELRSNNADANIVAGLISSCVGVIRSRFELVTVAAVACA